MLPLRMPSGTRTTWCGALCFLDRTLSLSPLDTIIGIGKFGAYEVVATFSPAFFSAFSIFRNLSLSCSICCVSRSPSAFCMKLAYILMPRERSSLPECLTVQQHEIIQSREQLNLPLSGPGTGRDIHRSCRLLFQFLGGSDVPLRAHFIKDGQVINIGACAFMDEVDFSGVTLRRSSLTKPQFDDGLGVFANRDFKAGEVVISWRLESLSQ